jgi:hypothetical protein
VRAARTGIVVLLAAALAGCGSGDDKQARLTNGQAQALVAQLEAARANAAARDAAGTKAVLVKFRRSVARLQRQGAISAETARALRIGALRLVRRVASDSAPPPVQTTPTVTQTAPAPVPPGRQKKHKEKHGKGHGKKGDD